MPQTFNVKFDREALKAALAVARAVCPSKSPKPILQMIKIEAKDDVVVMTATDMEIGVALEVANSKISKPGAIVISPDKLFALAKDSADDNVTVTASGHEIEIRSLGAKLRLEGANPDEFPSVDQVKSKRSLTLTSDALVGGVMMTEFCTDEENGRYAMSGIQFSIGEDSKLQLVGTDGRRISLNHQEFKRTSGKDPGPWLVPGRSCRILQKAYDAETDIKVTFGENSVSFTDGQTVFVSRLVEGKFPAWDGLVASRKSSTKVSIDAGLLEQKLSVAMLATDAEHRGVLLTFSKNSLTLQTQTTSSECTVDMESNYRKTASLSISLDGRFLLDYLKVVDVQKIEFELVTDEDPVHLLDGDNVYVVCPLTLSANQKAKLAKSGKTPKAEKKPATSKAKTPSKKPASATKSTGKAKSTTAASTKKSAAKPDKAKPDKAKPVTVESSSTTAPTPAGAA